MKDAVYSLLEALDIAYTVTEHEAAFTVEQADVLYGHLEGGHSKNLFLRNKKGSQHYLVVADSHRPVDLKVIRDLVGESNLSFASPERLMKYLGLTPGSVSPFGLLNDSVCHVQVLLDAELMTHGALNFHPNINTHTLTLATVDFRRVLAHLGHQVRELDLNGDGKP